MDPISDSLSSLLLNIGKKPVVSRASTNTATSSTTSSDEPATSDFEKFIKANLTPDSSQKVSEEDLFASLIPQRISKLKGEETAKKFSDEMALQSESLKKADGFIPFEEAAKSSLKNLVTNNTLTKEEADSIYSECFAAAQLDSNADALFDNRGGAGDPTIAVESIETALIALKLKIDAIDAGTDDVVSRSLDETSASGSSSSLVTASLGNDDISPEGTKVDGDGGFLFKPQAGNGKLAILASEGDMIESVTLKDVDGNTIEEGRFTSFGDDPSLKRAKFEFNSPGGSYSDNLTVAILMKNGTVRNYHIPDPSKRYD